MPITDDPVYIFMSALIVLGIAVIGWLLNKGFNSIVSQLHAIQQTLDNEQVKRTQLESKVETIKAVCDERHSRFSPCID